MLFEGAGKRELHLAQGTLNGLMRGLATILDDDRLEPDCPRLQHAMNTVQPAIAGGVRIGQVGLDASDSLAAVAQRIDRLQKVGHGLASIDVGVPVDDYLHC